MTRQTFLRNLKKLNNKYRAQLCFDVIRFFRGNDRFCPITAVYHSKTGNYLYANRWEIAAKELGLDWELSRIIVNASDDISVFPPDVRMRKTMLRILKLSDTVV